MCGWMNQWMNKIRFFTTLTEKRFKTDDNYNCTYFVVFAKWMRQNNDDTT